MKYKRQPFQGWWVEGNNGDNDDGNYVYECFIFTVAISSN